MRSHERVLRPYLLAKYAAAFFRMSRSSVTRLSSAFSRRTSAESFFYDGLPAAGIALRALRTHSYSVCFGIPMWGGTSITVKPRSITCFTASIRTRLCTACCCP